MDVDRHVERLCGLEHRPEPAVVERDPGRHAVQHRSLQAQVRHSPFQFRAGLLRRRQRQRGEAREPGWPAADGLVDQIVGPTGLGHRLLRRQVLRSAREMREHLQVDAGLVHGLQPSFTQIQQPLTERLQGHSRQKVRMREMLLEHDDLRSHGAHPYRCDLHRPNSRCGPESTVKRPAIGCRNAYRRRWLSRRNRPMAGSLRA